MCIECTSQCRSTYTYIDATQTYRCNIWNTYYRYECSLFDMAADTKARRSRKTVWQKVTTYRYIWYIQYVYTSPLPREDFSKIEFPHPAYFRSKPYSPLARILRWRQYARRNQEEVKLKLIFFPRSFRISRYIVYFFFLPGSSILDKNFNAKLDDQPRFFLRLKSIPRAISYYRLCIQKAGKIRKYNEKVFISFLLNLY